MLQIAIKTGNAAKGACEAFAAGKFSAEAADLGCQTCAMGKYVAVADGATKGLGRSAHQLELLVPEGQRVKRRLRLDVASGIHDALEVFPLFRAVVELEHRLKKRSRDLEQHAPPSRRRRREEIC